MFKALIVASALLVTATVAQAQERWNLAALPESRFCALRYQFSDNVLLSMGLHADLGIQMQISIPGSGSARETSATFTFLGSGSTRYQFPARYENGVLTVRLLDNETALPAFLEAFVDRSSFTITVPGLRTLSNVPLRGSSRGFDNLLDCVDEIRQSPPPPEVSVRGEETPRESLGDGYIRQVTFGGWVFNELEGNGCNIRATVEPNLFLFDFWRDEGFAVVMTHEKAILNDEFFVAFTRASGGSPLTYRDDDIMIRNNVVIVFASGADILPVFIEENSVGVMFPSAGWVLVTDGFPEAFEMFNDCVQRARG